MKKEAIGDITRSGGFSRLVRDVETSKEPILITRKNEVIAMMLPANNSSIRMLENAVNFGKLLAKFEEQSTEASFGEYLVSRIFEGVIAEAVLITKSGQHHVEQIREQLIKSVKFSFQEAGNAGEQPVAETKGKSRAGAIKRSPTVKKK